MQKQLAVDAAAEDDIEQLQGDEGGLIGSVAICPQADAQLALGDVQLLGDGPGRGRAGHGPVADGLDLPLGQPG